MALAPVQRFASYDRKLISVLEILGSHYVDIYYNHIWSSARSGLKSGGSIADEYVRQVKAYIVGVKTDPDSYRAIVGHLHVYFRTSTRYTSLSFADFVDRVVSQFLPPEYYALVKAPQKDAALETIVVDLVAALGAYVTTPELLRKIVDEHDRRPELTIRLIQDQGVTILLAKRGEIHNKFLRRMGQAKENVSMDVVEDLKTALRKQVKEKVKLKGALGETEERAMELEDELEAGKKREAKFRKLIRLLNEERTRGLVSTAQRARIPRENHLGEGDPLDFSGRDRHSRPPPSTTTERGTPPVGGGGPRWGGTPKRPASSPTLTPSRSLSTHPPRGGAGGPPRRGGAAPPSPPWPTQTRTRRTVRAAVRAQSRPPSEEGGPVFLRGSDTTRRAHAPGGATRYPCLSNWGGRSGGGRSGPAAAPCSTGFSVIPSSPPPSSQPWRS